MEKEIYNALDSTRGDVIIDEGILLTAIVGFMSAGEKKSNLGINFDQNTSLEDIVNHSGRIKDDLIDLIYRCELDNNLLKQCMIDTIENSRISDRSLQNIIVNINRIDLKTKSGEFIEKVLYMDSEYKKYGLEVKDPDCIRKIITKSLQIKEGDIHDGTCGIGDLLLEASNVAGEDNVRLYGQEIDLRTWILAQINLRMHGLKNFNIEYGDILKDPKFKDGLKLNKFDYVTMSIPFGMKILGYEEVKEDLYGRYKYGVPPKSNSDCAFIQHGLASLKDIGKAAIVVPVGVLFREATEKKIRTNIVNDDVIEAIIELPTVFTSTSIPVAIMILNKNKEENMKNKILFIKANELGKKERRTTVLSDEDIDKIVSTFLSKKEEEKFSKLVDIKEIQDNSYNLNVSRYIQDYTLDTDEGTVSIDIKRFEKDHDLVQLKDLAKFERGMNLPRLNEDSIPTHKAITLSDVQDGELNIDNLTDIELNDVKRIEKYKVNQGDMLLSCRGNSIKVAVVEEVPDNIIVSNNFIKITPNYNVNPYFIKAYFESPVGQYYLNSKQTGTTIKVLSASDLYDMPIPLLSIDKQNEVANKYICSKNEYKEGLKRLEEKLRKDINRMYDVIGINEFIDNV